MLKGGGFLKKPPSYGGTGSQGPKGDIGPQGPKGDAGDTGPPGSAGGSSYEFDQSSASDTWTINHALNRYPSVTVVDSSGSTVEGEVTYIDANNVQIIFSSAFAGIAYLN